MTISNIDSTKEDEVTNVYNFYFDSLNNESKINLSDFKGKVILIVNTASKCGLTSQYSDLEKLYQEYKDKGFVIIGVPSNDFGNQEPGNSQEIASFCSINYGVTFPMAKKEVVLGDNAHIFYKWAKKTLDFGTEPKWNFHKYLINRQGKLIEYFNSTTSPQSSDLKKAIMDCLE